MSSTALPAAGIRLGDLLPSITAALSFSVTDILLKVVYADGMLYCYESPKKGLVHLVKCSPEKCEETGVLQIPKAADKHWAHPAIADGKLFIRFNGTLIGGLAGLVLHGLEQAAKLWL